MDYMPRQGDIVRMDFINPSKGREQHGLRPALVVSNNTFNSKMRGGAIVCPITNRVKGLPIHVALDDRTETTGVVLTDQVKSLNLTERNARYIESVPDDILEEICDIVSGLTEIE